MIRHSLLAASVLAALAANAIAQGPVLNQQHTPWGVPPNDLMSDITGVLRFSLNNETLIAYLPKEDCIGWGDHPGNHDPSSPEFDTYRLEGFMFVWVDTDASTSALVGITIWPEDTMTPGVPAATPSAQFQVVLSGAGNPGQVVGFYQNLTFPGSGVFVPRSGGVFIGLALPSGTQSDLFQIGFLASRDPMVTGITEWDVPNQNSASIGHGLGMDGGFTYLISNTGQFFYSPDALVICPLGQQTLFATGVSTNQASMPGSNPGGMGPGYTTSPFSSRNPALLTDALGNMRSDDFVFVLDDASFNGSELIGVMFAPLGLSMAPIDLSLLSSTWEGTFCLDGTVSPPLVAVGAPTGTRYTTTVSIPAADRAGLLGLNFGWWAVALDFVTMGGRVLASPCYDTNF